MLDWTKQTKDYAMKSYGFKKNLAGVSFSEAVSKTTTALNGEGFGVLTSIDVKATFKKKLDKDFRPYTILGACNPALAFEALSADGEIGLLLPCNVVVQETEEGALVSVIDPVAMFSVVENEGMTPIVTAVGEKLARVLEAL